MVEIQDGQHVVSTTKFYLQLFMNMPMTIQKLHF